MDGKELLANIADLKDNLQKYLETKISYFGILAFEKAVKILSLFMANVVVLMVAMLALLFLSGAAAFYVGELVNSYPLGVLIIGGAYLLLTIILFASRNRLFGRWAIRVILNIFFSDDEDEKPR
ncbi:MAG: hypothetical protein EA394_00320 [Bacteroidia bacterium]|nr:MAG: hypothetical protein EA394_00320 [Bacteroidia bacterium]